MEPGLYNTKKSTEHLGIFSHDNSPLCYLYTKYYKNKKLMNQECCPFNCVFWVPGYESFTVYKLLRSQFLVKRHIVDMFARMKIPL